MNSTQVLPECVCSLGRRVTFMPINHPRRHEREKHISPSPLWAHGSCVCICPNDFQKHPRRISHDEEQMILTPIMGKREASGVRNWRQNDGPTLLCCGSLGEVLNLSFFLYKMGIFTNLPGRVVLPGLKELLQMKYSEDLTPHSSHLLLSSCCGEPY